MWIGVDDTDSPRGGCTTYVLTDIVRAARELGFDLIGPPRLVRLNPNVPWKTRGNAALSARFGHGTGRRRRWGEIDGEAVPASPEGRTLSRAEGARLIDAAWERVLALSRRGDPGTDPALVAAERQLPASMYWRAVGSIVRPEDVRAELARRGAVVRTAGSERGIVGAAAAIAWRAPHPTWELLAYRPLERSAKPRRVDVGSVVRAQGRWPGLFLCFDARTRRLLVAPHTPCPILFGLRARDARTPVRALPTIRSEPIARWMLFCTNQGTGDHLSGSTIPELAPYTSGRIDGHVGSPPVRLRGGHVRFELRDGAGRSLDCIAFEPTKTLPRVAASLGVGDHIRVWGGRADDPVLRLEGIEVVGPSRVRGPPRAPRCPRCDRRTRSLGAARGYRCPGCRRRWPPEAAARKSRPREPAPGVYHPTPSARRHLALLGPETLAADAEARDGAARRAQV